MKNNLHANNKKGSATIYLILIMVFLLAIIGIFIRLNWRRFKAEASFGFAVTMLVIATLLIFFLMIRHSMKKAKKERLEKKEAEQLEKEAEKQERLEAREARKADNDDAGDEAGDAAAGIDTEE